MSLFPMFVKLEGRLILMVGAGPVGEGKIESLLASGATVRVIAPQATPRVREWAREKRAFISSVMAELVAERQAAAAGVRTVGLRAVMFEEFGGRDADPEEAYLAEVEGSDIYIGILGRRYGKPLKSRFSATHAEYIHAEKHALRMAVLVAQRGFKHAGILEWTIMNHTPTAAIIGIFPQFRYILFSRYLLHTLPPEAIDAILPAH